jgi:hypothetical protein
LAYAHLPYDSGKAPSVESLITLAPASIRLLACKRSWDGEALIIRLQEAVGRRTVGEMRISPKNDQTEGGMRFEPIRPGQERGHAPVPVRGSLPPSAPLLIRLDFKPFEIRTLRVESDGTWSEVRMIEEDK